MTSLSSKEILGLDFLEKHIYIINAGHSPRTGKAISLLRRHMHHAQEVSKVMVNMRETLEIPAFSEVEL